MEEPPPVGVFFFLSGFPVGAEDRPLEPLARVVQKGFRLRGLVDKNTEKSDASIVPCFPCYFAVRAPPFVFFCFSSSFFPCFCVLTVDQFDKAPVGLSLNHITI